MKLTKEEAIRLHRQMWTDMLKELGDNPSLTKRVLFKLHWCQLNGYDNIENSCFLCEYTSQEGLDCDECPIDWTSLYSPSILLKDNNCDPGYIDSSISDILALPERSD